MEDGKNENVRKGRMTTLESVIGKVTTGAKKVRGYIKNNSKKLVCGLAATAILGTTMVKDNVYFGSTILNNPKGSHYVWGVFPTTTIKGGLEGNVRTFGLIEADNSVGGDVVINGNLSAYGGCVGFNSLDDNVYVTGDLVGVGLILVGHNTFGDDAKINGDALSYGSIYGANIFWDNAEISGDISGYALGVGHNTIGETANVCGDMTGVGFIAENSVKESSKFVGNISTYGIFCGETMLGKDSKFNGNMDAYGIISNNCVKPNSVITGNFVSRGILASIPTNRSFGSATEIGLENYLIPCAGESNAEDKILKGGNK